MGSRSLGFGVQGLVGVSRFAVQRLGLAFDVEAHPAQNFMEHHEVPVERTVVQGLLRFHACVGERNADFVGRTLEQVSAFIGSICLVYTAGTEL